MWEIRNPCNNQSWKIPWLSNTSTEQSWGCIQLCGGENSKQARWLEDKAVIDGREASACQNGSCTSSRILYAMPPKVCDVVDKIIRDFLWGLMEEKRRMHMVNWNTVTLPKDLGGLGLHSMKDRNLAILAKLCWRLASDQGAPWA